MPHNIYDDPDFFAGYSRLRRSRDGLAGAPEWPTLRAMLPPLAGLRVLDLGCGFGAFARWAADQRAASVLAVDSSQNMLREARNRTQSPTVTYLLADMTDLALPAAAFDLVYSTLALHYVEDLAAICAAIRRRLAPAGRLVFSVEHPLYTAPRDPAFQTAPDGSRYWPTTDYLVEGRRITDWIAPGVVKYHRTLATYLNTLLAHGFHLTRLEEWGPSPAHLAAHPEWADEVHRPPFLLVAAHV